MTLILNGRIILGILISKSIKRLLVWALNKIQRRRLMSLKALTRRNEMAYTVMNVGMAIDAISIAFTSLMLKDKDNN